MNIYAKKIEVVFDERTIRVLDGQSKICNWLYNHLLDFCKNDYENNENKLKLLSGRNLRNRCTPEKVEHPFLYSVHSSPIKNTAIRVKESYEKFFKQGNGYPKFKSWKEDWFSLFYDEPDKGFAVKGNILDITLGAVDTTKPKAKNNIHVSGVLKSVLSFKNGESLRNFRLVKELGRFYAVFTVAKMDLEDAMNILAIATYLKAKYNKDFCEKIRKYRVEDSNVEELKWISIDPNHKNFFTSIDYKMESLEFKKLDIVQYWDIIIDKIKSKRDKCSKYSKEICIYNADGTIIKRKLPSKRWVNLNKRLHKAYLIRREQIKQCLFTIANFIQRKYDVVYIGDYTPSIDTSPNAYANKSVINQTFIGEFRRILKWVMKKNNKICIVTDEKNTTKTCCICGHKEKKGVEVRQFKCVKCKTTLNRDVNSAINIAKKNNVMLRSGYETAMLSTVSYTALWNYRLGICNDSKSLWERRKNCR